MRKIITLIILSLGFCCFSQSQTEMNQEALTEFNRTDKKLNEVYQNILRAYKTDTSFIGSLKKSQHIWITFRNAELEMKYPMSDKSNYGSSYTLCKTYYLKELTEVRIEKLKIWLTSIKEGDMCSGSVKTM